MPFIKPEIREHPCGDVPGDRCYLHYKEMVEKWKASPRWTTADEIYAKVVDLNQPNIEWQRAKELAWQVFFQLHVMPYELKKQAENGAI